MTAIDCPATVSVPLRELVLVLAVTAIVTVPLPLPLDPLAIESQERFSDAVQLQPFPLETLTLVEPAPAASERLGGDSE